MVFTIHLFRKCYVSFKARVIAWVAVVWRERDRFLVPVHIRGRVGRLQWGARRPARIPRRRRRPGYALCHISHRISLFGFRGEVELWFSGLDLSSGCIYHCRRRPGNAFIT